MIKTKSREADYLLHLINCALKGNTPDKPQNVNMEELLKLADFLQVHSMVLPCLEEIGALDERESAAWRNHKLSELSKTILVNSEREEILAEFEKQGIDYMFLKGLVIREYYPKSSMRLMGDNDILYRAEKRDELLRIMKKRGYLLNGETGPSDDFIKPPCTFEFHRELFNDKDEFGFDLDLWQRGKRNGDTCEWLINPEDNYIYSIMHMYKHAVFREFNFRFICDTFVLRQDESLDFAYIDNALDSYGLSDFHEKILHICDAVFADGELSDDESKMLDAIINCTSFDGSIALKSEIEQKGGKLGYFMSRMFPPRYKMAQSYARLEKQPYLLPYYYIKRLIDRSRYNGGKVKKEIKGIINNKKD